MDGREDAELVREVLEGNTKSFRTLIEKYKSDIFSFSFYMLGNFHDAEDISQEVFLTVFRKLESFKTGFKFKNWLLKITHNKCINFLKAKRMTSITLDDGLKEKLSREERSSLIDHERVMQLVREAVAELDPQSRSIFTLFHFEGLPYSAISEITEKSTGNLKVIVHRARKSIYEAVRRKQESEKEV